MKLYHGTNVDFHFQFDIPQAMDIIYTSRIYELLSDPSNCLYVQSAAYVYELLKKEYLTGDFKN